MFTIIKPIIVTMLNNKYSFCIYFNKKLSVGGLSKTNLSVNDIIVKESKSMIMFCNVGIMDINTNRFTTKKTIRIHLFFK